MVEMFQCVGTSSVLLLTDLIVARDHSHFLIFLLFGAHLLKLEVDCCLEFSQHLSSVGYVSGTYQSSMKDMSMSWTLHKSTEFDFFKSAKGLRPDAG